MPAQGPVRSMTATYRTPTTASRDERGCVGGRRIYDSSPPAVWAEPTAMGEADGTGLVAVNQVTGSVAAAECEGIGPVQVRAAARGRLWGSSCCSLGFERLARTCGGVRAFTSFRSLYRERIKHVDRYRVNTSRGEPGISTNSLTEAEKWAEKWGTEVEEVEG